LRWYLVSGTGYWFRGIFFIFYISSSKKYKI